VLVENIIKNTVKENNMKSNTKFNLKKHIVSTALYMSILLIGIYFYNKTNLNDYNLNISIKNNSEIKNEVFNHDLGPILKNSTESNSLLLSIKKIPYIDTADILKKENNMTISFTSKKINGVINGYVFDNLGDNLGKESILSHPEKYKHITTNWIGDGGLSAAISILEICDTRGYILSLITHLTLPTKRIV